MADLRTFEFQGCHFAWRIDGSGPPLLVIQGVGAYGTSPNPLTEVLARHYACLSFDNRGIGRSQPAAMELTVEQMATDALALMDQEGWESAHVMGHSLGGLIALQLALIAKRRVRSLSLLCTFARGAVATRMTPKIFWIGLRMRFAPRRLRRIAFMELVLPPGQEDRKTDEMAEFLAGIFGHDIADVPPITNAQLGAMKKCDVTGRLGELAGIPALVISGEHDLLAPPFAGRVIAGGIPDARYLEIPNGSHAFPILEPERCAAMIYEGPAPRQS